MEGDPIMNFNVYPELSRRCATIPEFVVLLVVLAAATFAFLVFTLWRLAANTIVYFRRRVCK